VAIYGLMSWPPNLGDDLYAILVDNNPQSGGYTFKAYLNPLVAWVWLGGFVVIIGTHIAVLPEWKRSPVPGKRAVMEAPPVAS
jgi:cytochrome c-type biogenesis protein CcmF